MYEDPERRFRAILHPDGRVSFRDRVIGHGRFMGPHELIVRAQGVELHQGAKRALHRETFDERLAMHETFERQNLAQAERALWGELRELWYDERLPIAERKRLLFERWQECDVDADRAFRGVLPSGVDRQRGVVARRARRAIEHFVRLHVADTRDFDFLRALASSHENVRAGRARRIDPIRETAIAAAPDLFEECERDEAACITVGDLLVGRRANAFDAARGAQYYRRACEVGDPWACYELGVLHYLGLGVPQDDARSAELHERACERGITKGCDYLAHLQRRDRHAEHGSARARRPAPR